MSGALPPVDQAQLPAAVRNGSPQRKQDYQAALAFERALVGQMTQAMTKSGAFGDDEGGDAATQQLKASMPETLADALMTAGGIGLAGQLDQLWHPAAKHSSVSSNATTGTGGATA